MKSLAKSTVWTDETAKESLSVSTATIRNWIRLGVMTEGGKITSISKDVLQTGNCVTELETGRLTRRANKTQSTLTYIPSEYCLQNDEQAINAIINIAKENNLSLNNTLFYSALSLLSIREEVIIPQNETPNFSSLKFWKRKNIYAEIENWVKIIDGEIVSEIFDKFKREISLMTNGDVLGAILQSFQTCGKKNCIGSYYTPSPLVDRLLDDLLPDQTENIKFLDPACGTGQILLRAAKRKNISPSQLYGIELDELAWRISRINLLLEFPNDDFSPNIILGDALFEIATSTMFSKYDHLLGDFDIVATNPPWGAKNKQKNKNITQRLFPEIQSEESFSLFIIKCLNFAKQGGRIALFLPEAILNISAHKDIRKILLEQTKIQKINLLGHCFSDVFTNVISLILKKVKANSNDDIFVVDEDNRCATLSRKRFIANRDHIFDILVKSETAQIIDHIYAQPHFTLRNNADWALGIVTGNNEKFLMTERSSCSEPIYRGCEIDPFCKRVHKYFINFTPEQFQQTAPERKYRSSEKLIYKFISKKLTFAYDSDAVLTLNSANILIPLIREIPIKIVLAFLNSTIAQFIHEKRFCTFKVLRKNIEELPIPRISPSQCKEIEPLVNAAINGANNIEEIDKFFTKVFSLSEQQKNILNT